MKIRLWVCLGLIASLLATPVNVHAEEKDFVTAIHQDMEWYAMHRIAFDDQSDEIQTKEEDNSIFSDGISLMFINNRLALYPQQTEEETDEYYGESYDEIYGYESTNIYSGYCAQGYDFSDREIWIMAQVMHHEAGNQCEAGQIAVVEVILNRLFSVYFPDTVCGVVYQPRQFSYVERSRRIVPTDAELELVQDVILGNKKALDDSSIMYYRNPDICIGVPACYEHDWGSLRYVTYIQDHAFYRDEAKYPSDWSRQINSVPEDDYEIYEEEQDIEEYTEEEVIEESPAEDETEEEYREEIWDE